MNMHYSVRQGGFSLIELVAVMVIVAVIAAVAITRIMPSALFQMQAAKDQLVSALAYAQQRALYTPYDVRVILSGNSVDIREDTNGDSSFAADESIRHGSVTYPLSLVNAVQVSPEVIDYDSLGEIGSSRTVSLSKGGRSVDVAISISGYAR